MIADLKNKLFRHFYIKKKVDLHRFDRTVYWTIKNERNINALADSYGELISDKIKSYKKSDTLFILGSGPSINAISDEQWSHISKHDSIGFNTWFVHDFVPSLYVFQKGEGDRLLKILESKKDEYKEVPIILRGNDLAAGKIDAKLIENSILRQMKIFFLKEYFIHPNCQINPMDLFDYAKSIGVLNFNTITPFILKNKVSIGLILSLAYEMGYKKIVLCGTDMKDASHFWDYPPNDILKQKYDIVPFGKDDINDWTNNEIYSTTIPDNIVAFSNWVNKEAGVEVFIANENTLLYPSLKLYF